MRLLYILDFYPFIEDRNGLSKIYFNLLDLMSKKCHVDVLIVAYDNNIEYLDSFSNINNIMYESIDFKKYKKYLNILTLNYYNTMNKKDIKKLYSKYNMANYDLIHTAMLSFSNLSYFHENVVIGATDSLSLTIKPNSITNLAKKLYYKAVEYKLSKKNAWIHLVTDQDSRAYSTKKKFVITNGVDTKKYHEIVHDSIIDGFVFHGNLDYVPNINSIYYMSNVLNKINCKKIIYLVGRGAGENFKGIDNLKVVGEVENIASEITKYKYYLILMLSGTGVKNKLLEAMSCNCQVIANKLAINGLEDLDLLKESIFLVDKYEKINDIVSDNHNTKRPLKYIKKYYTWESFVNAMNENYINIIKSQ